MSRETSAGKYAKSSHYEPEGVDSPESVDDRLAVALDSKVSHRSVFADPVWSWEDSSNPRLACYAGDHLTIRWSRLSGMSLSEEILEVLKKYAFFRLVCSKAFFPRTRKNAHPASMVTEIGTLGNFLSSLCENLSLSNRSLINNLSEIEVQDLRTCLNSYPKSHSRILKSALINLASPFFIEVLNTGSPGWRQSDIETLSWKMPPGGKYGRLPDELFCLLSNSATEDVTQFLQALKIQSCEPEPSLDRKGNKFLAAFSDFKRFFGEYVAYKKGYREGGKGIFRYNYWSVCQKHKVREFSALLTRARLAAQIIIMLFTGARRSELAGFKLGCLRRRGEIWFMVGTVIKGGKIDDSVERDEWVAIPIVRDAVRALKETARLVDAKVLFHDALMTRNQDTLMSADTMSYNIRTYIKFVDDEGKWTAYKPSAHQFRNSLVYELRKAGLSVPFISYQLKHDYDELERSISGITIGYGSLADNAVINAVAKANDSI
ncbi:MAG: site-specific integrase [Acidobacteriota bacterium]|nr:site-specific integrase [Acidobacteriota bacterium]